MTRITIDHLRQIFPSQLARLDRQHDFLKRQGNDITPQRMKSQAFILGYLNAMLDSKQISCREFQTLYIYYML